MRRLNSDRPGLIWDNTTPGRPVLKLGAQSKFAIMIEFSRASQSEIADLFHSAELAMLSNRAEFALPKIGSLKPISVDDLLVLVIPDNLNKVDQRVFLEIMYRRREDKKEEQKDKSKDSNPEELLQKLDDYAERTLYEYGGFPNPAKTSADFFLTQEGRYERLPRTEIKAEPQEFTYPFKDVLKKDSE